MKNSTTAPSQREAFLCVFLVFCATPQAASAQRLARPLATRTGQSSVGSDISREKSKSHSGRRGDSNASGKTPLFSRTQTGGFGGRSASGVVSDQWLGSGNRFPVPADKIQDTPFKYIGAVTNASNIDKPYGHGTATLIAQSHIVTAAHVVEAVFALQQTAGEPTFVLPDGRSARITHALADGGWKRWRISSYDLAVARLASPLGNDGSAQWAAMPKGDFSWSMVAVGYDGDFATKAGRRVLVARAGPVGPSTSGLDEATLPSAGLLFGGLSTVTGYKKDNGLLTGLGFLTTAVAGASAWEISSNGWQGSFEAAGGASGSPLFRVHEGGMEVVGVQSMVSDTHEVSIGGRSIEVGTSRGSRITSGPAENMIREYIQ